MAPRLSDMGAFGKEKDRNAASNPNRGSSINRKTAVMRKTLRHQTKTTSTVHRSAASINAMKQKVKRPSEIRLEHHGQLLSPTAVRRREAARGLFSPKNAANNSIHNPHHELPVQYPIARQKKLINDSTAECRPDQETKTDPNLVRMTEDGRTFCEFYSHDDSHDFARVIWPILGTLGFHYTGGGYRHEDIKMALDNVSLRRYLCAHGVPRIEKLCEADRRSVEYFVKFANVPEKDYSSAIGKLGSLDLTHEIFPDEEIKSSLGNLGFTFMKYESTEDTIVLAPGASELLDADSVLPASFKEGVHYFRSMKQVRVYVRSREILSIDDPMRKRTRKHQGSSTAERSQDRLSVRLWGATSAESLPTFNEPNRASGRMVIEKEEEEEEDSVHAAAWIQHHDNNNESTRTIQKNGNKDDFKHAAVPGEGAGEQADDRSANAPEGDAGAMRLYQDLRLDITIQRKLRNACRASIGLGPIEESPMPENFHGDIKAECKRLHRILGRIRLEIELTQEMDTDM